MRKIVISGKTISLPYSQVAYNADDIVVNNEVTGKLTIENYPTIALYKNEKCNFSSSTVEYKFCTFFNLNTAEELTAFFDPYDIPSSYNREDYLDCMKLYNNKDNFYGLDSKYIFDNGINKEIFIKYINHNETFPRPIYSVFYIQDFSNNLIVKDMGGNFDLGLFLIGSNTNKSIHYLNSLNAKEIDITLLCNDFLENIKNQSKINNLYDIADKKYSPFFDSKDELVINENILSNNFSCNYKKTFQDIVTGTVLEKNETSKEEVSETYQIPIEYLTKDNLTVKEIINVNTVNSDFVIIKFYDFQPIIKTDVEILNNNAIQHNNLLFVLTKLDFEFFVDLFFDENNEKFPELKTLTKDADGTLNISKLAAAIEKNESLLKKYLD